MPFVHTQTVDRPVDEVFAWHGRPGAINRLVPPWQPVRVAEEASSLESGTAVLAMPGGLKWIATHQADLFDPPHRFVDVLTTPGVTKALHWRHTHEFEADGSATVVIDRVDTNVPDRFLDQMFAYRSRQLAGDLTAHRWASGYQTQPLTVAVTGASGLIGSALCALLSTGGHQVIKLVRGQASRPDERRWQPDDPASDLLEGVDAVVHLAGQSIAGRFSESHKESVRSSRIGPTRKLAELVGARTFLVASAVGFYGPDRGEEDLTEDSDRGGGFLADVVADWEAAAEAARRSGSRVVHVRTGVVQSPKGGALRLQRPLFEAALGGRLGNGEQWLSWIGIDDLLDIYLRGLVDPEVQGPVNAVAPEPVRNSQFTDTLAHVLHRPALLPVPAFGPRLLFGSEGVEEFVMANQKVLPSRLVKLGHSFRHPDLESALRHVLGRAPL